MKKKIYITLETKTSNKYDQQIVLQEIVDNLSKDKRMKKIEARLGITGDTIKRG